LKKILFIVSEDWYFMSHRISLAKAAISQGYEVSLLTRISIHESDINSLGIQIINWPIERRSRNPFKELKSIYHIIKAVRKIKPDLVYSVAIKPVFYTILSKFFFNIKGIVLAFAGLGFIFRSDKASAKFLRFFVVFMFRLFLIDSNVRLIVQNKDDIKLLNKLKILNSEKIRLIRGAGVSTTYFYSKKIPHKIPLVILPGRMLWDKGVGDFVRCAQRFFLDKYNVRFALIGEPDIHNPESVPQEDLINWQDLGYIEYWGRQENMFEVYNKADLVCFPSYHEGLPRALLEAASCELPIVAYDVSGCREIVINNENGYLLPFRDENGLFQAIMKLLESPELRRKMGLKGRQIVMNNFTDKIVISKTTDVWEELI
jgi:glycosyltransferase involved in cell wall biosynthesis